VTKWGQSGPVTTRERERGDKLFICIYKWGRVLVISVTTSPLSPPKNRVAYVFVRERTREKHRGDDFLAPCASPFTLLPPLRVAPLERGFMDCIWEATRMLDAFVAAGADRFDVTRTTIHRNGVKGAYRPAQTEQQMRESLPYLVAESARNQTNLIIRPHVVYPAVLIQLDDLPQSQIDRIWPLAFLLIRTSSARRQAWCLTEGCDFACRQEVKRAVGSDVGANGWVRAAGTPNIKPQYAPGFPIVQVERVQPGLKVTPAQLRELELIAPQAAGPRPVRLPCDRKPKTFPRYEICLDGAPATAAGEKDRSLADFCWCCTAIRWGWPIEDAAAQLVREPLSKAHERGHSYALSTASKAAKAVSTGRTT